MGYPLKLEPRTSQTHFLKYFYRFFIVEESIVNFNLVITKIIEAIYVKIIKNWLIIIVKLFI